MINKYDLYDMSFALIKIRSRIQEKSNIPIISQMIKVLEEKSNADDNQIRKAISSVGELDCEYWEFAYHNNVYVNHYTMNKPAINTLLIKLLKNLLDFLNNEHFEKAYDLVDSFHCLPEIIAENNMTIPKSFWKTFISDYQNKWDRDFLRLEKKFYKNYLQ